MKFLISFFAILLIAGFAFADDPGDRDSLIIETVYAELGDSTVDVRIYVTTDDSVGYYSLPLTWSLLGDSVIYPVSVSTHNIINQWDVTFYDIYYDLGYLSMLGWDSGGDAPFLITSNYRILCWSVHFAIDSFANPQIVTIDTTYDPINGSLLFGLVGGVESLVPVFIPGAIYYGIPSDVNEEEQILPSDIAYMQNYPNPFNAATTIEFTLPEELEVELLIYDILGQKVAVISGGLMPAGSHSATWDAGDAPSGIYFARLETIGYSENVKMILLK